ncbi:hypothetical protein GCM10010094_12760 [Streptomyces flaveus]|uniref:Uncharacterized protein n=1 Tax=Streptomyces flaveus TaxID=66370 RepID=A0A917QJQ4_9ACTN|nr:hypothetical protein GCM10010094_12760 [Streptomyces flaveus]
MLRPFFFGFEAAGTVGETGSGSFGGWCVIAPSEGAPGPNGEFWCDGTTGMPLVRVCPETFSPGPPA